MFFRARDQQRRFYEQHVDYVYQLARRMSRDEEQALEVVQRVFVEVVAGWGRIADVREARPWLAQVTRNQCWRMWRERGRHPIPAELDPELRSGVWGGALADPDARIARTQMRDAFVRAFQEHLNDEEQQVIQMRYLSPEIDPASDDAFTLDQLAQALGVARITVRRRLDRAREKLGAALAAEGFAFEDLRAGDET